MSETGTKDSICTTKRIAELDAERQEKVRRFHKVVREYRGNLAGGTKL